MEKVLYVGNDLAIDLGNLFGFSGSVVDHDECLQGVDAGVADAAALPAGLLDELSGGQLHIAVPGGVGYQVGELRQQLLMPGLLNDGVLEEAARAPDLGDVGELAVADGEDGLRHVV